LGLTNLPYADTGRARPEPPEGGTLEKKKLLYGTAQRTQEGNSVGIDFASRN
jgi:hypothetical protein